MAADKREGVVDADCGSFAVPNLARVDGDRARLDREEDAAARIEI